MSAHSELIRAAEEMIAELRGSNDVRLHKPAQRLEAALADVKRPKKPPLEMLEAELRDAHEGQGNGGEFLAWVQNMADNPDGTLQWAAQRYLNALVHRDYGEVVYVEDKNDGHRFQICGHGVCYASSKSFDTRADAEEGFEQLKRIVARTVFSIDWPHGVQRFAELPALVGDNTIIKMRGGPEHLALFPPRIESGPVRFGDDWTGLFLRGDSCFAYALALRAMKENKGDAFSRAGIDGLITALESTNERTRGCTG